MSNEYDDLIAQSTTQAAAQSARFGFSAAADTNPDSYAQAQQLARRNGVPVDTVLNLPAEMKRQDAVGSIDFDALAKTSPATAVLLSDIEKAKIAHDDVENMSLLENLANSFKRGVPRLKNRYTVTALNANANAAIALNRVEQGLAAGRSPSSFTVEDDPLGAAYMTPEQRSELRKQFGGLVDRQAETAATRELEARQYPQPASVGRVFEAGKAEGLKGMERFPAVWNEFVKAPVEFIASVGPESLVGSSPGLVLAVPAGLAGGPGAAAAVLGSDSFGSDYASSIIDALKDNGVDIQNPAAVKAAMQDAELVKRVGRQAFSHAAIVAGVDALSAGAASKVALPAKTLAARPLAREMANMAVQQPIQGVMGGVGEFGGQVASGQEIDPANILAEFAGEYFGAPAEVLSTSVGVMRERAKDVQRAQTAEQTATMFEKLNELAAASKVAQRDTGTFEEFIAQATENGPVQQVYVDAKDLMQSGVAEQVAALSMAVAAQLPGALQTGGQVAIPVEEYTARIAPTEFSKALVDHLKVEPNDYSRAEAKQYVEQHADDLKAEVERVLGEKQGDETFKASADAVRENIFGQLESVGRNTAEANQSYATLAGNWFAVTAAKLGITPEALYERYPLKVQGVGAGGFEQPAYHGSPHRFERFDLSKMGTGEGAQAYGWGQYFADSKDVAEGYRTSLGKPQITVNGEPLRLQADDFANALRNVLRQTKKGELFSDAVEREASTLEASKMPSKVADAARLRGLRDGDVAETPGGQLYAVDIPDEQASRMLDWDKPLSEQPEFVRDALKGLSLGEGMTGQQIYEKLARDNAAPERKAGWSSVSTDSDGRAWSGQRAASEYLRDLGIPGLRYLDGNSRADGQGTRNTVVWDQNLLDQISDSMQTFYQGKGTPSEKVSRAEQIIRGVDEDQTILYHSGDASIDHQLAEGIEPNFGDWLKEVLSGAVDDGSLAEDIRAQDPVAFYSEAPTWVARKVARVLHKPVKDVTVDDIREHGQLSIVVVDKDDRSVWREQGDGTAEQFSGQTRRSYTMSEVPFGVERGDIFTTDAFVPEITLTGDDLVQFLQRNAPGENNIPNDGFNQGGAAPLKQGEAARGSFNPNTLTISMLEKADLSTYLHELGHFFLEVQFDIAAKVQAEAEAFGGETNSDAETQFLKDTKAILDWFGVESIDAWHEMSVDQQREHHEKFARGFESYLFEGKSPSIEMQGLFQRFRAWLLSVYRDIKNLNVTLTDEVRGVFDRMVATNEEIKLAEQGRNMMPLFETSEKAGMTPEEFKAYQALGIDSTNEAIEQLQTRGLRDMQWLHNARARALKQLQKDADFKRAEMRIEARREVMSQPVYQAWQFLTRKMSASDKIDPLVPPKSAYDLDETRDSLLEAVAKLGGIDRESATRHLGVHKDNYRMSAGVFGKPPFRKTGGLSADAMGEALLSYGYLTPDEYGKHDMRELEEKLTDEIGGTAHYSVAYDYGAQFMRAGDQVANLQGLNAGRLDLASLRETVVDEQGDAENAPQAILDRLVALKMVDKNGLHPDLVASMFGFTSGDDLVRALAEADPPADRIETLTDLRMLERYGDLSSPEALEKAADKAVHNNVRLRFLATEANALSKAIGKRGILASAAKEYAEALVSRLKVRNLTPGQYAAAETKAAKAADKAMKAGDIAQAAAEKRNQVIQGYAAKAVHDAIDSVDKARAYLAKFDGNVKGLEPEYLEQIRALVSNYDLRKGQGNKAVDRAKSLRSWVMSQLANGEVPDIAESMLSPADRDKYIADVSQINEDGEYVYPDEAERVKLLADYIDRSAKTSYRDLTVEQLRGLVDTVRQIEHLGRLKQKLLNKHAAATLEEAKTTTADSIRANARKDGKDVPLRDDTLSTIKRKAGRFGADHIRMSVRALVMDGGKDGGPMWDYFIRPANEAEEKQVKMHHEATVALNDILAPILKNVPLADRMLSGKKYSSLGTSLNWSNRFAILLNLGNEGNTQRLLSGGVGGRMGLTLQDIMPIMSEFSAAELHAAQKVWDLMEGYRPELAALELETKGKEPDWVEPRALTIRSKDGELVTLRGGYYPAVYDPLRNSKVMENLEAEEGNQAARAARAASTTRQTFTKMRADEVHGRPMLLTLDAMYSGIGAVIHDLSFRRYAMDTSRLLRSKRIQGAMREHYGAESIAQLRSFVTDLIAGPQRLNETGEMAAAFVRQNVALTGLGLNVVNWLQQPFGIANAVVRLGGGAEGIKWVGKGLLHYAANPVKATKNAMALSEFLTNRPRTRFRELNEIRNKVQVEGVRAKLAPWMMWGMVRTQMIADVIAWRAGYERAVFENPNITEQEAAAIADQVVRDSQGGGEMVDLSRLERGGALSKLFTTFFNFQNTGTNLAYLSANTDRNAGKRMSDMLMVFTVPVLVGYLFKEILTPGDSGDDEEKALKKLLVGQLTYLVGSLAFVREINPAVEKLFGEGFGGYQGPTGLKPAVDAVKLAEQVHQGELDDAFRKAAINMMGDVTGLPSGQINRTVTGAQALADDKTDNPAAIVFGFKEKR